MNLTERVEYQIKQRKDWLKEAEAIQTILEMLPEEIRNLDGNADIHCLGTGSDYVAINTYGGLVDRPIFEYYGFEFSKLQLNEHTGDFSITSRLGFIVVTIASMPKPDTCEVKEVEYMAKKYEAVCKDSK